METARRRGVLPTEVASLDRVRLAVDEVVHRDDVVLGPFSLHVVIGGRANRGIARSDPNTRDDRRIEARTNE